MTTKLRHARELLAPVYGWFTEGFDTLDLKEAKALLMSWRHEDGCVVRLHQPKQIDHSFGIHIAELPKG
jgi:hypothetical protein